MSTAGHRDSSRSNANAFYRRNGWLQVSRNFDEASEAHKIVFVRRKG
jgi:hypothetical protein